MLKKLIFVFFAAFLFFISCKKDKQITAPGTKLTFSQDSVLFDTVFTKIGSTTKLLRVHNPNNGKVVISSIKLARGDASYYRLNVDGSSGKSFSNIEIAAKDSVYIFVEVTIDPNNLNNPFIYQDSILFELNGNQQDVDLVAFGQNAYYHMPTNKIIESPTLALYYSLDTTIEGYATVTWKNDKPHVIYGYLVVDSLHNLIIPSGTKVYLHNSGGIWVYRYGSIQVNGTVAAPVIFQGDRLEQEYKDVPGQWDRIWINEGSTQNIINYAIVKNAYIGVHAGYSAFDGFGNTVNPNDPKQLTLTNTIIQNCTYAGLLGHYYNIVGGNNVVANCGKRLVEFDYGGNYFFYQSTFANYWTQTNNSQNANARTSASFYFNNYYNGSTQDSLHILFANSILDGSLSEEFQFDTLSGTSIGLEQIKFDHCAIKTTSGNLINGTNTINGISINANNIQYKNVSIYDFHIASPSNSAAKSSGNPVYIFSPYDYDIEYNQRSNTQPDLGAYIVQ